MMDIQQNNNIIMFNQGKQYCTETGRLRVVRQEKFIGILTNLNRKMP